jgi:hypothetical protein
MDVTGRFYFACTKTWTKKDGLQKDLPGRDVGFGAHLRPKLRIRTLLG